MLPFLRIAKAVLFIFLQSFHKQGATHKRFGRVAQWKSNGMNIHVCRFNSGPYHQSLKLEISTVSSFFLV